MLLIKCCYDHYTCKPIKELSRTGNLVFINDLVLRQSSLKVILHCSELKLSTITLKMRTALQPFIPIHLVPTLLLFRSSLSILRKLSQHCQGAAIGLLYIFQSIVCKNEKRKTKGSGFYKGFSIGITFAINNRHTTGRRKKYENQLFQLQKEEA